MFINEFWETPRFKFWHRRFCWWADVFQQFRWRWDAAEKLTRFELAVWDRVEAIDSYNAHEVELRMEYF
jgi:hypothetical protein